VHHRRLPGSTATRMVVITTPQQVACAILLDLVILLALLGMVLQMTSSGPFPATGDPDPRLGVPVEVAAILEWTE
jgi:hypothetical protein